MAAHIEARSLSSLNQLADNPPQYPVNPAETPRESLTLYITRVPGTRDIILSTLKPQLKTISAEDISNSLYYAHLQLPSEEQLTPSKTAKDESQRKTIPRKPLPERAASEAHKLEDRLTEAPIGPSQRKPLEPVLNPQASSQPNWQAHTLQVSTDGLGHEAQSQPVSGQSSPEQLNSTPIYAALSQKPLGPRSMGAPPLPPKNDRPLRSSPPSASSGPYQTPNSLDQSRQSTSSFSEMRSGYPHRSPSPTKPVQRPTFTPSTLTLIRRDPSSNHQQNVARITSCQTNIPTPDMAAPDLSPENMPQVHAPAINIRIENPGYSRFRDWPTRAAVDKYAADGNLNLKPGETIVDGPGRRARGTSFTVPHAHEPGFNREVVMTYGKSWTSNIKSAFHMRNKSQEQKGRSTDDEPDLTAPRPMGFNHTHRRQDSAGSAASQDSTKSWSRSMSAGGHGSPTSPPSPILTRPGPGLKPKGYMFTSPWDGRCEFRTGQGGRSLVCRHILDSSSSRFPTAILGHGQDGARVVSELRFNLPGSSSDGGQGHHARHSFQGKFDKLLKLDPRQRRGGESSDDYEDGEELRDGGMDLQLGYERAGGGKRGNRAKLGKLIIHDEGLKMLDLVVAANIGMLWASWERIVG